jgi:hypothetical protein
LKSPVDPLHCWPSVVTLSWFCNFPPTGTGGNAATSAAMARPWNSISAADGLRVSTQSAEAGKGQPSTSAAMPAADPRSARHRGTAPSPILTAPNMFIAFPSVRMIGHAPPAAASTCFL